MNVLWILHEHKPVDVMLNMYHAKQIICYCIQGINKGYLLASKRDSFRLDKYFYHTLMWFVLRGIMVIRLCLENLCVVKGKLKGVNYLWHLRKFVMLCKNRIKEVHM